MTLCMISLTLPQFNKFRSIFHNANVYSFQSIRQPISLKTNRYFFKSVFCFKNSPSNLKHNHHVSRLCSTKVNSLSESEEYLKISHDPAHTTKYLSYKQEDFLKTRLEDCVRRVSQLTNKDWDDIECSVLSMQGLLDEDNISAVILNYCCDLRCLSLGQSYFKYLKTTNKIINRAVYGNYLRLFYVCSLNCSKEDLKEIETVYKELLKKYPLLDAYTCEKAICALSITPHWKEYEKLFKEIKKLNKPTSSTYSVVIKTALSHDEFPLAWELIAEMYNEGLKISDEVFIYWLEIAKGKNTLEHIVRVLDFFETCYLKPSFELCKSIKHMFEKFSDSNKGKFTHVLRSGQCKNCYSYLQKAWVSSEEYNELKTAFLNPVLVGNDIFQKTRPEEFTRFLGFLEESAPYDIVLDGLNIAFRSQVRSSSMFAFQLKCAVRHFASQNKKVLVLGRKHMKKWPTEHMNFVYQNAKTFLAEDLSQDDPFLLYAALYSGLGTCFVSRDMMRGHKFLLSKPKLQTIFQKWQSQHQCFILYIEDNGTVHVAEPIPFMQSIQRNSNGDWHIPYFISENLTNKDRVDTLHRHWLCLTSRPIQKGPTHSYKFKPLNRETAKKKGENLKPIDWKKLLDK